MWRDKEDEWETRMGDGQVRSNPGQTHWHKNNQEKNSEERGVTSIGNSKDRRRLGMIATSTEVIAVVTSESFFNDSHRAHLPP